MSPHASRILETAAAPRRQNVKYGDPAWGEAFGRTPLDSIADAWARERGVELPDPDSARFFLSDGALPREKGAAFFRRREGADRMRDYLSHLETRLEETDWDGEADPFEHGRIALQAKILQLRYREGRLVREIAHALGRQTGSWTSYHLRLIRIEAGGRKPAPVMARLIEPPIDTIKRSWRSPRRFDALVDLLSTRRRVSIADAIRLASLRGMLGLASSLLQLELWARRQGLPMPIDVEEHEGRWRFLRWVAGVQSSARLHPDCRRILSVLAAEGPITGGRLMTRTGILKHDQLGRRLFDLRSAAPLMGLPRWVLTIRGHRAYFSLERKPSAVRAVMARAA